MDSLPTGVIVFFAVATIVAALCHLALRRYGLASLASALTGPFAFAGVCMIHGEGISLPTWWIFLFFLVLSGVVALVVGFPILVWRVHHEEKARESGS
ncbi:MAG: hypothetical protein JO218_05195 [Burkholderiales bacterium]|nr:hypothetical protein [Burkholderiales bacterium]